MILLIDSYDSFSNNLARLIKESTGKEVIIIQNDSFAPEEYEQFFQECERFIEYVVIGPGPGHPGKKEDVGIIHWLINKIASGGASGEVIPVLGICLGFQSICHEFGNEVARLANVKHGQIYKIHPTEQCGIYQDTAPFESVRYHSLYVDGETLSREIRPLAYCYEEVGGAEKLRVLMAVGHRDLPLYGVQYHPESVCSQRGSELIKNFDKLASGFNKGNRNVRMRANDQEGHEERPAWMQTHAINDHSQVQNGFHAKSNDVHISFQKLNLPNGITPVDVCDYFYRLSKEEADFILLNSASTPGEWSIIGFPTKGKSTIITHSVDEMNHVYLSKYQSREKPQKVAVSGREGLWSFIAQEMRRKYIPREAIVKKISEYHSREIPFFGGYLGLISYEEGQHIKYESLESMCTGTTPDLKLVEVDRSLVFDHVTKDWFIISICDKDDHGGDDWLSQTVEKLKNVSQIDMDSVSLSVRQLATCKDGAEIRFELPSQDIYKKQFEQCQEFLHSGDSYELCLTTQSKIFLPAYVKAWEIYKVLTLRKNPSPFSCFMSFDDCCLVSSSPERFLSCKDQGSNKVVELRPIKGTVRNTPDVDMARATQILKTPKEMGENLMIVDLIRHDLHQFSDNVTVAKLMSVEEYKTVFQLVSVIRGVLPNPRRFQGIDLLQRSLPPGSMTGAPKKRSVELLQSIESLQKNVSSGGRRGIYSGVVGYWSVTDDSDWSVIIRSVFHYKNDSENSETMSLWRIGAGGAITVLSDVEGEWDEMNLKLTSALQAFD
ncbi:uncharacterized protein LODBEIA_P50990 [Lodderomyces beijingensis]|uniref:aminodeoxychorismate synthase n=1 Tax=Lodderomyces beijingensis TaxID=1775926 RepID=A0ABP0ZW55_9ASCO